MELFLHNSLSGQSEHFVPLDPGHVSMYLCGPTVYDYVHVGNGRPAVVFDVLVRLLRRHFPRVTLVRNITDVDDKINAAAAASGESIAAIANRYTTAYHEDMAQLGVLPPDFEPRATEHLAPIIAMIESLIDSDHAYTAEGHVLFDVASYPDYGALSRRSVEDMIAGARVEVAPYKRNPADFVLWKPSTPELPGWQSPWGRGRPGWHIECSAMSAAHLGETIDIHAGGNDLKFPHHENEIAQSVCAHDGKPFARYWLHNGMLSFEGKKMSKSLGNTVVLHELLQRHPPEALRLLLLRAHYRQPLDWSEQALAQATSTLDRWYGVLRDVPATRSSTLLPVPEGVERALADDLNTPQALAEIARLADAARVGGNAEDRSQLLGGGALLGLLQQEPESWFRRGQTVDVGKVEALIAERNAAREARDFARADAIRGELAELGIGIEDSTAGTRWSVEQTPD